MSGQRHAGPSLLALTIVYLAMLIAGGTKVSVAFHVPHVSADAVAFVAQNGGAIRWGSFFELASAMPLGIFMAVSISRLRFLGIRSAGEQIAALGGIATPIMLAGSASAECTAARRSRSGNRSGFIESIIGEDAWFRQRAGPGCRAARPA